MCILKGGNRVLVPLDFKEVYVLEVFSKLVYPFYLWNTGLETEFSKSVLKICDPPPRPQITYYLSQL